MPLIVILSFRAIEELSQHIRILSRDRKINKKKYTKIVFKKGKVYHKKINSESIKVGDMIVISNERVPADIIIFSSQNESVYVKTD